MSTVKLDGLLLRNVHSEQLCAHRVCVVHNPTNHHMRTWPLNWRGDRGLFERICPHGVGHPDPDQYGFWDEQGTTAWMGVHGCDGCCADLKEAA